MTGVVLGLLLGLGLFSIWWSCWTEQPQQAVASRVTLGDRLQDDLVQAGYGAVSPKGLALGSIAAGTVTFVLFVTVSGVASIAGCFAAIAFGGPTAFVRARARRRRSSLRELWPDAVDNIASGVRAGLALPEALAQVGVRGPAELRPAFTEFAQDYRTTGRFGDCLDRLKTRLSDPVGDRLVEALRLAREVGGSDLGNLLRTLSHFLREDARARGEIETRQGWTVSAARLAVAAPWIVLAMLSTRPEAVSAYATSAGTLVLIGGAAVTIVAYRLMVRIGRLPEEARVLR